MKRFIAIFMVLLLAFTAVPALAEEQNCDCCITVPSNTELFVGAKGAKHFVSFTEILPSRTVEDEENGTTSYYFEMTDNSVYNYRISSSDYITYAGKFKKTPDFNLNITREMLETEGKNKTTVDRDTSANNGYNVADIYLNINSKGYLKLNSGDTYQLIPLRRWEAVDSTISNYFIEPDYHYSVSNDSIADVDENGLLTAKTSGTAIVYVTYDALNIDFGSGKQFYGAIWPENTGVFVVSVDSPDSEIETGMTLNENSIETKISGNQIDAEHDVIYFTGNQGKYNFTPNTEDCTVFIYNNNEFTAIDKNDDNSFDIPLNEGRNIVKLEKDGKFEYQIITAKQIEITVNNNEPVHPGDELNIVFSTLYHPADKLAGVYNMSAIPVYKCVSGYNGKFAGAKSAQYNFASSIETQTVSNILKEKNVWGQITYAKDSSLVIPSDYLSDTFTLSEGSIYVSGFGDPYGNHRGITLTDGKAPNLNANAKLAFLGCLPDISIPVIATDAELVSISLENVKTNYFTGDKFNTENLIVTANYADGKIQTATNYTVSPEVMTEGTHFVTISYNGKTVNAEVNVSNPQIIGIEATAPTKIDYTEGDSFDPTGIVVTATYENGVKKAVANYSYSPNRTLLPEDSQIELSYNGFSTSIPITVTPKQTSGETNKITVYFTLLGDSKHGESDENVHTMIDNNLQVWIAKTAVSVNQGSCLADVITKALSTAGIPYTNYTSYISGIKGLKEFDNGPLSGWMYTVNGKYPLLGINEQIMKNGDKIVFHYTDDYTKEQSSIDYAKSATTSTTLYTVSFETNGGSKIKNQSVEKNAVALVPAVPEKNGFEFDGWYTDKNLTKAYSFDIKVTGNITLYAGWKENIKEWLNPYNDVKPDDWFYEAVKYASENDLMQGTDIGFEPEMKMTREMLVNVLFRLDKNEQYADAFKWAYDNKIINGTSEESFQPDKNGIISREQAAVILYRYAKSKKLSIDNLSELSNFEDKSDISDWANEAFCWANGNNIISGTGETTLSPKETATRAEIAAIVMRFCLLTDN